MAIWSLRLGGEEVRLAGAVSRRDVGLVGLLPNVVGGRGGKDAVDEVHVLSMGDGASCVNSENPTAPEGSPIVEGNVEAHRTVNVTLTAPVGVTVHDPILGDLNHVEGLAVGALDEVHWDSFPSWCLADVSIIDHGWVWCQL